MTTQRSTVSIHRATYDADPFVRLREVIQAFVHNGATLWGDGVAISRVGAEGSFRVVDAGNNGDERKRYYKTAGRAALAVIGSVGYIPNELNLNQPRS